MAQLSGTVNPNRGSHIFSYSDSVIQEMPKKKRVPFSITRDSYVRGYHIREVRMARQGTAVKCRGGTQGAKDAS